MYIKGKQIIYDKINILAQADVHIGTHTELAPQLGL
jgi:hypothetical protein